MCSGPSIFPVVQAIAALTETGVSTLSRKVVGIIDGASLVFGCDSDTVLRTCSYWIKYCEANNLPMGDALQPDDMVEEYFQRAMLEEKKRTS